MTTEYVQRLHFFLGGVIRMGIALSIIVILLLIARGLDSSLVRGLFDYHLLPTSNDISSHRGPVVLTLVFIITFVYSLFGALITGASDKTNQSICFSCLFSTTLALSIVGLGLSWIPPFTLAIWWMISTVLLLIGTSYFARKKSTWQTEPQKTGKTY